MWFLYTIIIQLGHLIFNNTSQNMKSNKWNIFKMVEDHTKLLIHRYNLVTFKSEMDIWITLDQEIVPPTFQMAKSQFNQKLLVWLILFVLLYQNQFTKQG